MNEYEFIVNVAEKCQTPKPKLRMQQVDDVTKRQQRQRQKQQQQLSKSRNSGDFGLPAPQMLRQDKASS